MSTCKNCGMPLAFIQKDGKKWPTNPDGSFHFDTCRQVQFDRLKQHGETFTDKIGEGLRDGNRKMYTSHHGVKQRPKEAAYLAKALGHRLAPKLPRCNCDVPPWEDCIHTAPPASQIDAGGANEGRDGS